MFGLWFPCCLLLVDVHHLEGKLKDSRLDPKNWLTSKTAWQIGLAGRENQMQVLEFCTVLHDHTKDLLGKLGQGEMKEVLRDFCAILDGHYAGDAECMTGWPCAMLYFLRVMPCHEYSVSCRVRFFLQNVPLHTTVYVDAENRIHSMGQAYFFSTCGYRGAIWSQFF